MVFSSSFTLDRSSGLVAVPPAVTRPSTRERTLVTSLPVATPTLPRPSPKTAAPARAWLATSASAWTVTLPRAVIETAAPTRAVEVVSDSVTAMATAGNEERGPEIGLCVALAAVKELTWAVTFAAEVTVTLPPPSMRPVPPMRVCALPSARL